MAKPRDTKQGCWRNTSFKVGEDRIPRSGKIRIRTHYVDNQSLNVRGCEAVDLQEFLQIRQALKTLRVRVASANQPTNCVVWNLPRDE